MYCLAVAKLVINTTILPAEELDRLFPHIQDGGHWEPENCTTRQKLGIFVPLRNRPDQLPILLRHLHQLLVRQLRHYTIFVIEQVGTKSNSLFSPFRQVFNYCIVRV